MHTFAAWKGAGGGGKHLWTIEASKAVWEEGEVGCWSQDRSRDGRPILGYFAAYQYPGLETGQGWTAKARSRPYQGLIKALLRPY